MGYALITGAGIRIGRAIAQAFAHRGDSVILHANRSIDSAQTLASEIRHQGGEAHVIQADLNSDSGVARLAELTRAQTPVLDTLVNNAAIYERVPFEQVEPSQFLKMLQVNLMAPFFLTQRLMPLFEQAQDPSVVNIIDTSVHRPEHEYSHYSTTKAGLLSMTKSLSAELGARLRVNGVAPGAIAFPERFSNEEQEQVLARVPMGRIGSPEDIAKAAVFLAKDGPYISGEMIHVDGGWNANG